MSHQNRQISYKDENPLRKQSNLSRSRSPQRIPISYSSHVKRVPMMRQTNLISSFPILSNSIKEENEVLSNAQRGLTTFVANMSQYLKEFFRVVNTLL